MIMLLKRISNIQYCLAFFLLVFRGAKRKHLLTSKLAIFVLFIFTLFSLTACSDNDDDDTSSALTSANVVEVVFSPSDKNVDGAAQGFCDGFLEAGGADAIMFTCLASR